ncbi:MAG: hypothetical protein AAB857_01565, partial [Patescibacteria group bacterium]
MNIVGGSVGIGTTGPLAVLQIQTATESSILGSNAAVWVSGGNATDKLAQIGLGFKGESGIPPAVIGWKSNSDGAFEGDLVFATADRGDFTTAPIVRMTVKDNGFIGIGTTAPSTKLEVQGTASASYGLFGTLQVGGFSSASYNRFGTSTTGHSNYISASNDLLVSGDLETRGTASFGGVASISGNFFTYGANTFSGTGSSSFAGSLLISKGLNAQAIVGTSLTINGNASITGNTTLGDATGDTLTSNADAWTFANDTNFTLSGGVNGLSFDTNTLSIDATNNRVGILTTTPSTTFEVQGTASASYFLTGNTIQVGGFSSASYNRFGVNTTSEAHYITGADDLLISGDLEVDGSVSFAGPASISNTLYISTLGKTGNVGIGSTSPNAKLDVAGTASVSSNFGINSNKFYVDAANSRVGINTKNLTDALEVSGNASISNVLYAVNNGNVGISNTTPDAKLDVAGNITASSSGNVDIVLRSSTTNNPANNNDSQFTLRAGSTSERFEVINGAGAKLVTIASAGGVNIIGVTGTSSLAFSNSTAPGTKVWSQYLQESNYRIYENAANTGDRFTIMGGTGSVGIGSTAPVARLDIVGDSSYPNIALFRVASSSGTVAFYITKGSNVGIGTTAPSYKLDVVGDINIPTGSQYKINGVDQVFDKWTAGSGNDIYRQNGNVGIGTTAPSTKLEVQGTASASYGLFGTLTVGDTSSA